MIDLDSDRWGDLRHAYGTAADIPALLRQLPTAPVKSAGTQAEPWGTLWSALCHQSDVYPASYAAVPHIVAAAAARAPEHRAEYLVLVGSIESMRHKPTSPAMLPELEHSYKQALQAAIPLALEAIRFDPDEPWVRGLLDALAAFRGFPRLGSAITDLEREIDCPFCERTFIAPGYDYFG